MDMSVTNERNGRLPFVDVREFYVFLHMLTKAGFERFDGYWYSESEGHPASFSGSKYESGAVRLTAKELEAYSDLETAPQRYADSVSVNAIRYGIKYSIYNGYEHGIAFMVDYSTRYDKDLRPVTGELAELLESFYDMVWEYHEKK